MPQRTSSSSTTGPHEAASAIGKLSTRTKTLLNSGVPLSVVPASQTGRNGGSTVLDSRLATSVLQAELRAQGHASALMGGDAGGRRSPPPASPSRLPLLTAATPPRREGGIPSGNLPSSSDSPTLPNIGGNTNSNGVSTSQVQRHQANAAAMYAATPASEGLYSRKGPVAPPTSLKY